MEWFATIFRQETDRLTIKSSEDEQENCDNQHWPFDVALLLEYEVAVRETDQSLEAIEECH